ncbi:hypothetical protein FISHEDRAFT_75597 [Fistulina hepatica ATCC 64428]|uniref:F-box domain-containing protein n=1 Tax=Fistulina hepatica ATCC 64428 TaxID=1128425 RepID=A0A0D7A969_9AGAR|nr:hypothetical protein FISHEDRAFT_75597 [Fistulina hepatica ATCC 64428]
MAEILTCRHCGHDVFPPLPTRSFDVHELKEGLRDGFLPSSSTMKCIEQEIANLEATIKDMNDILEDARAALVRSLNPVVEYLAVVRSVSSPIRRLPEELLSNVFSYLITSRSDFENDLQNAMFEAGILGRRGSTIHRLASVCKYWWHVVRDTPTLCPAAYVSYGDEGVLAVRRYIEMTSPHPLKFSLHDDFHCYSSTQQMEEIEYCAVLQELVNAASRWQTADLERMGVFGLENALDFETQIAACVYRSSYPVLKELCLHSFPMSQFFSQEQVPALRVLKIYGCQMELHAVQPVLLQITDLDLRYLEDIEVNFDFHAMLSYAPALSQLTVYSTSKAETCIMSRNQSDARSPVLLSHLRRLHVNYSTFMLNIITAPNLVHFQWSDDPTYFNVVDEFLRRSQCNIESLHLDIWSGYNMSSSIVELLHQMPHVTHLTVPAHQKIWVPLKGRTPDGRFLVFPQLQRLEIYGARTWVVSDIMRVVLKRCGTRKIRFEGRTGYRKSKKPHVLRRLDISCPLTRLQRRTLLVLSECGALDVCCSVSGKPARNVVSDDDSEEEDSSYGDDNSDSEEGNSSDGDDSSDSEEGNGSDGDDDGVVYI